MQRMTTTLRFRACDSEGMSFRTDEQQPFTLQALCLVSSILHIAGLGPTLITIPYVIDIARMIEKIHSVISRNLDETSRPLQHRVSLPSSPCHNHLTASHSTSLRRSMGPIFPNTTSPYLHSRKWFRDGTLPPNRLQRPPPFLTNSWNDADFLTSELMRHCSRYLSSSQLPE